MTDKEYLEAVDWIYQKSQEENSEMRWGQTQDALAWLMLEYKENAHIGWWKTAFEK